VKVDSTAIRAIDYDAPRRQLEVTFVSGERYAYFGVSSAVHRAFMEAESKGQFFRAKIRGRYPYSKLPGGAKSSPIGVLR